MREEIRGLKHQLHEQEKARMQDIEKLKEFASMEHEYEHRMTSLLARQKMMEERHAVDQAKRADEEERRWMEWHTLVQSDR